MGLGSPLYQMALHVLENDPSDSTNVWFISAHRTEEDIILGDELEALHEKHGDGQFRSNTVICRTSRKGRALY